MYFEEDLTDAIVSDSIGSQALQSGNSNLPSPAGSCVVAAVDNVATVQRVQFDLQRNVIHDIPARSKRTDGNGDSKNRSHGNGKPDKPKRKGNTKSSKRNLAGESGSHYNNKTDVASIKQDLNTYKMTKVYKAALEKTFKTPKALESFNRWVEQNIDSIDPSAIVVCTDCGHSDLQLCDCWITAAPNSVPESEDSALAIPSGPANIKWRFQWVDRVKRMFAWPTYNPDIAINHNIGFMTNSSINEESMIIEPMLCYIRQHQNTSYVVDGLLDRKAKLSHSKKLAIRFLDETKMPLAERLDHRFVACMHHTIQKATDSPDDDFLLARNNEDHNIGSLWKHFHSAPVKTSLIVTAAIACPILVSRLDVASIRLTVWAMKRFTTNVIRTWVHGSVSILGLGTHMLRQLLTAIDESILSGRAMHCLTAIQQWLCSIARTTSSTVSRIVSSRLPLIPSVQSTITRMQSSMPDASVIASNLRQSVARVFSMSGMNTVLSQSQTSLPSMLYYTV
nr:hypothetical protein [Tolivirales sp.]